MLCEHESNELVADSTQAVNEKPGKRFHMQISRRDGSRFENLKSAVGNYIRSEQAWRFVNPMPA